MYEYDTLGRLWKLHTYRAANPDLTQDGDVTTWDYIAGTNALWKKTDAAERSVTYSYNEAGLLETRTRPRTSTTSIVTTYDYQQSAGGGYIPGRLTRVDYSDSTPDVTHEYDRAGRRKTTTDAAGTHTFTYDAVSGGQPDTWTVAGTGVWSGLSVDHDYTHGQRSSRATSLGGIALPTAGYTYHSGTGRMETVTADGVTATYRYNAATGWNEGVTYSGSGGLSSTRTPDALGRLDTISWSAGGNMVSGHDYTLNGMNRRTAAQREDGSQWSYGYNDRGEVTSATKVDATNIPEPGKQFGFQFDGLGNRTSSTVSSLASDEVMRSTGYTANALNQYDEITHPQPGWLVLRGSVNTEASVSIDGEPPTVRSGPLWHYEKDVNNSSGPVRRVAEITATRPDGGLNNGPVSTSRKGAVFIPPPSETPTYDWDGNLTSDARWDYTWDGENRLIAAEEKNISISVAPDATAPTITTRQRIECTYDSMNRRIRKVVKSFSSASQTWSVTSDLVFLYDRWNMIAEINMKPGTSNLELLRSYQWGLDLSGTIDGAGGVGGLLIGRFYSTTSTTVNNGQPSSTGAHAPCYDGNGNVTELVNLATNTLTARYEYGPFGETISVDGSAVAETNSFRFSTKYLDGETGLLYYTHRYYDAANGRWCSKDPIAERGGINLYGMVENSSTNRCDYLGLATVEVTLTRGQTGYFAVYGRLSVALRLRESEKQKFECCAKLFPKSFLTMESSDTSTITPPGEYTPYFSPENSGGGKGSTSIRWKLQRGLAASPAWWSSEDVQAAMPVKPAYMSDADYEEILSMEFHIGWSGNGGGNNVHFGPTSNHSDGCVLIGTHEITARSYYNFSRHSELVKANGKDAVYQAPAFALQDTVNSQFTLLEAIQCARKKGANVKFKVTNPAQKRSPEATAIPERSPENGIPVAGPVDNF